MVARWFKELNTYVYDRQNYDAYVGITRVRTELEIVVGCTVLIRKILINGNFNK